MIINIHNTEMILRMTGFQHLEQEFAKIQQSFLFAIILISENISNIYNIEFNFQLIDFEYRVFVMYNYVASLTINLFGSIGYGTWVLTPPLVCP